MKMTQIKVTKENVVEVSMEKNVYVIKAYAILDGHSMTPADRCSVPELLSEDNIVIKIEN